MTGPLVVAVDVQAVAAPYLLVIANPVGAVLTPADTIAGLGELLDQVAAQAARTGDDARFLGVPSVLLSEAARARAAEEFELGKPSVAPPSQP